MICDALSSLMIHQELASHLRAKAFVCGVVFGVSAAPEIPMPETWMPWVLGGSHDSPLSHESVDSLADALIAQLQWQLARMRGAQRLQPEACVWSEDAKIRRDLELWLSGVLYAHKQLEPVWQAAWQKSVIEDADSRLARCLKCFSVLADSELTLGALDKEKRQTLETNLPVLSQQLNGLLVDYVTLAGELAAQLPGQFELYADHRLSKKH